MNELVENFKCFFESFMPAEETVKICADLLVGIATLALAIFTWRLARETKNVAEETKRLAQDAEASSYRQIGVQTWLEFTKRFDSEDMLHARAETAHIMQRIIDPDYNKAVSKAEFMPSMFEKLVAQTPAYDVVPEVVPDFFETVSTTLKLGFLDKKLARDTFGYYLWRWYLILENYIQWIRKEHGNDMSLYCDFQELALKWADERGPFSPEAKKEIIVRFLYDERLGEPRKR